MGQVDLGIPGLVDAVEIGRGGFGVVFRAHDTQFDRDVAVKVLTVNDVSDEQQRRRFERERRLLGRLSEHPGIVSIFSAGVTADGRPYLVLPYLPGGTVADVLAARRALPVEEVHRIGHAVAGALAFAHEMGVLHLDVKPANVLIDRFGHHLLADFGIARLVQAPTTMLTGTVSATPVYAAPEVLDLQEPTAAADVYSLGALLYTAAAGSTPYEQHPGEGLLTYLARVATTDPAPLGPDVDPGLRDLITRCLARSPAERPSAAEVARHLAARLDAADPPTVDVADPPTVDVPAAAARAPIPNPAPATGDLTVTELPPRADEPDGPVGDDQPRREPAGPGRRFRGLAFAAVVLLVAGAAVALALAARPDGGPEVAGGGGGGGGGGGDGGGEPPAPAVEVPRAAEPLPEATMLVTSLRDDQWAIWQLDATSGAVRRLTTDVGPRIGLPALSPDRRSYLYTKEIPESGSRQLWVARVDGSGELQLLDGLASDARAAWSPDGRRIAVVVERQGRRDLALYDLDDGTLVHLTDSVEPEGDPAWSPDGLLAFWQGAPGGSDLWVLDPDSGERRQLTSGPDQDADPAWSPDGTRLAFSRTPDGQRWALYTIDASGGAPQRLTDPPGTGSDQDPAWSPDGRQLAFESRDRPESAGRHLDVWVVQADGSDPRPLTDHPGLDAHPAWR